jgi:hypothetical protein
LIFDWMGERDIGIIERIEILKCKNKKIRVIN